MLFMETQALPALKVSCVRSQITVLVRQITLPVRTPKRTPRPAQHPRRTPSRAAAMQISPCAPTLFSTQERLQWSPAECLCRRRGAKWQR